MSVRNYNRKIPANITRPAVSDEYAKITTLLRQRSPKDNTEIVPELSATRNRNFRRAECFKSVRES